MTEVEARSYGVDVASYQPSVVSYTGAKFAVVKLTEGTNYLNPKAGQQIKSAKGARYSKRCCPSRRL